jgi:sugar phosphate isomerase/epimerase
MRYSVFTVCLPDVRVEEAVDRLAEWGYDGVEWRVVNQQPAQTPGFWAGNRCTVSFDEVLDRADELRIRCEKAGLAISGVASYVKCDDVKGVERALEAAARMGAPQARVGVPGYDGSVHYRKLFDEARSQYVRVEKLAAKRGVRANIELHMGNITPSASAGYRFMEGMDPAHVGVIYDPGNMVVEGFENWKLGLELLGDYLAMVHVKNAAWKVGDRGPQGQQRYQREWTALDEGQVDWAEVMKGLKSRGYDSWLSVEDFSTGRPTARKLCDDLGFLKGLEASV